MLFDESLAADYAVYQKNRSQLDRQAKQIFHTNEQISGTFAAQNLLVDELDFLHESERKIPDF